MSKFNRSQRLNKGHRHAEPCKGADLSEYICITRVNKLVVFLQRLWVEQKS